MKARTIEEASAICTRNANGKTGERDPRRPLTWDRETINTLVSDCGRYRLIRRHVEEVGTEGWFVALCDPPRHLSGPYLRPEAAREAAQMHARGEPIQADLA